jgi:UDP-N-acetyl-D-mannosaminuronic acid dehydrogenase
MSTEQDETAVAVVGMGYVGTSLSAVLAEQGICVYGIDIDTERVKQISDGICPVEEAVITDRFETAAEDGRITATDEFGVISEYQTVIVTVGTPLSESDPDLSAIENATEAIGTRLVSDQTVIYRSTLPAGTTEETILPILESQSGLTVGEEFQLAFCPERMAEGSAYDDLTTTPVVVGGVTEDCSESVTEFWDAIGLETYAVSSPTAAELTKLADNWWVDLNIALANEVALLSEQLGVDALEVIAAANTLKKGSGTVNILYPGAGVGGSCLVKDPWFVANLGEQHGLDLETPRVSRRVNERMPAHVVDILLSELPDLGGRQVAVMGYAFKTGTDDTRNTPAKPIVKSLQDQGATVRVADPYVPSDVVEADVGVQPERLSRAVTGVDAIVIVTGHDAYRSLEAADLVEMVGSESFVVVDGRNVFEWDAFDDESVTYRGVGRGRRD